MNEELLNEATRVLDAKSYSAAVNTALAEVLRVRKILSLPSFFGRGLWQGDLKEMRKDHYRPVRRKRRKSEKKK